MMKNIKYKILRFYNLVFNIIVITANIVIFSLIFTEINLCDILQIFVFG